MAVLLLVAAGLGSCDFKSNKEKKMDKFFTASKSMDRIRLPLIKPYEAINPDNTKWIINLPFNADAKASLLDMSIANLQSLAVQDSVIIVYAENTNCGGQPAPKAWFIIQVGEKIEKCFTDQQDYQLYLQNQNIVEPELQDINKLWKQFDKEGRVYWFPE